MDTLIGVVGWIAAQMWALLADLAGHLAAPHVLLAGLLICAVIWGRADRAVERWRFSRTLAAGGLRSHQEYIRTPAWTRRRQQWLAGITRPACRVCAAPWRHGRGRYHLHHLDYSRAGSGMEPDRDLMPVCHRCHTIIHRWDRVLRAAGVSLRVTSWLVAAAYWPRRALRR